MSISLKSQLAPKGLQFNPSDFNISDKYATILSVISYPRYIAPGYLSTLTSMSGIKIVIKHIPVPFSTMSKMINRQVADLRERYRQEKDQTTKERIRQDAESLESFVSMLASSQSRIFDFQMHIMINADTKEDLELRKVNVKNYLDAMELRAVSLRFEQEKVLKSILPIFPNQDIEERIGTPIPTPTIAAMYPFIFDSIKDPGLSVLLGVDFSGGVILFNQFLYQIRKENNRNNANMIILGTSGSGKSTAAKLLLRSHIRNGCQIVAIDPENELEEMTRTFGGDTIDIGKGGEFGLINPLEVIIDADDEEIRDGLGYTVLTRTLQSLRAFMKYYDPSIEEDVLNMFSEIVQDTYKRFGIDFNTDFSNFTSADYPTFSDVYATIKGRLLSLTEQTREKDIIQRLELKIRPLIKELKFYFDGKTTLTANSDFMVFNIKEFMNSDTNIRNALFFNILKYAWGLCLDPTVNTILMVDEAHVLLSNNNEQGADFLAQVQRRARKYNTGTIIITQQPSDFSSPSIITQGKAIFDNSSYYLVMGLRKQAVEDLSLLIDLNENEKDSIKRYSQGEALFVCGNRRMRINIVVTQEELESFGSAGGF
ncbi:MAG TPA: ATP-binding protein [Candidatus Onthousia faecipullorum]|uniref:ATP-binding protein n=1 Tax=Candidatus Onthousia faecipullorum TaxID=2840887 RepID=A0A9D1GAC4_9FIRM|nr:ATP-binding protein [Candidatus Onthousia faecipullorum]